MTVNDAGLVFGAGLSKRGSTAQVILHHAAAEGSVEAIHSFHLSRGWYGIGYHYYVRKDGSIWRGRPEDTVGAHTVGRNGSSVGICFEGDLDTGEMPAVQRAAGRELIEDVLGRYPGAALSAHRDHDSTACPGKNFPEELLKLTGREDEHEAFVARLTEAQAYSVLEKARRHAATLPLPEWAREEYSAAVAAGITDGERPMDIMPRWQGAVMALRGRK